MDLPLTLRGFFWADLPSNILKKLLIALLTKLAHHDPIFDFFLERVSNKLNELLEPALVTAPRYRCSF